MLVGISKAKSNRENESNLNIDSNIKEIGTIPIYSTNCQINKHSRFIFPKNDPQQDPTWNVKETNCSKT